LKKAIIIGASSGIGRALAGVLAENGFEVGLVARRLELLEDLKKEIPGVFYTKRIDVISPDAGELLKELIGEMGGADLIVVNAGISATNPDFDFAPEFETIKVNVTGFTAMTNVAVKHFLEKGRGHLVGISSIAGLRGSAVSPAYSASKAFVSNYLEGIRQKLYGTKIFVTDIRPGFVNTPLIKGHDWAFWITPVEKAARKIYEAVKSKKKVSYVTRCWWFVAQFMKIAPDFLYDWGYNRVFEKLKFEKK